MSIRIGRRWALIAEFFFFFLNSPDHPTYRHKYCYNKRADIHDAASVSFKYVTKADATRALQKERSPLPTSPFFPCQKYLRRKAYRRCLIRLGVFPSKPPRPSRRRETAMSRKTRNTDKAGNTRRPKNL